MAAKKPVVLDSNNQPQAIQSGDSLNLTDSTVNTQASGTNNQTVANTAFVATAVSKANAMANLYAYLNLT